ncbi:hypothetical protein C6W19_23425 [Bacillus sp. RJGP41]|nr:hypothetical protein C6W19_23425 [Bacillus sp. RJGP41]
MTKSGKTYTFHANAHGDITSVTDAAGTVVACFEYDAWGNQLKESGNFTSQVPFRYAGYRYDSETKLYYLQQRYYNSEIGRFLTLDPNWEKKRIQLLKIVILTQIIIQLCWLILMGKGHMG